MARAAGGTSQRLNCGPATIRSRERNPGIGSTIAAVIFRHSPCGCVPARAAIIAFTRGVSPSRLRFGFMRIALVALLCYLVMLSEPAVARSSLLDNINAARANGCGGKRGVDSPLRSNRKLDAVARNVARGKRLKDALADAGYRALHSSVMSMSGAKDNADIARMLGQRACAELRNPDLREIGLETRGDSVWVVFAAPFEADALKNESR